MKLLLLNLGFVILIKSKNFSIIDPIEQFELFFSEYVSLDTGILIFILNTFFLTFLFYNLTRRNVVSYFMNKLLTFYKELFFTLFTKREHQIYFFPFFFIFVFILVNNFIGLLPYTYTATSLFALTLFLAFVVIGGITWISFEQHKWSFLDSFFPKQVPLFILILLVCLELISYVVRIFSLALRLFANMLSGHLLLKILLSFLWLSLSSTSSVTLLGLILNIFFWVLIVGVIILELIIAFLQAYVFVFLSLIYLKEALKA